MNQELSNRSKLEIEQLEKEKETWSKILSISNTGASNATILLELRKFGSSVDCGMIFNEVEKIIANQEYVAVQKTKN
jgi:hypothetical protein